MMVKISSAEALNILTGSTLVGWFMLYKYNMNVHMWLTQKKCHRVPALGTSALSSEIESDVAERLALST